MHVAYTLDTPITDQPTILTIGKFDGVHIGHQLLLRTAIEHAQQSCSVSAVLTFNPHPQQVVAPNTPMSLLTSIDTRMALIAALQPDFLIVAPFNTSVMNTSAHDYMQRICSVVPLRELWMGSNFALGHNREGTIPTLIDIGTHYGYTVHSVAPLLIDGATVSSSRVRQLIHDGIVEGVKPLLGRNYAVEGRVVHGEKRGRLIGFPTANIVPLIPQQAIPARGVYAGYATIEMAHIYAQPAVINIGTKPTFTDGRYVNQSIEVHLLNWRGTIYDATLHIEFCHRLRGEQKFHGIEELATQIERDVTYARTLLAKP